MVEGIDGNYGDSLLFDLSLYTGKSNYIKHGLLAQIGHRRCDPASELQCLEREENIINPGQMVQAAY